jgi:hypothetical protein
MRPVNGLYLLRLHAAPSRYPNQRDGHGAGQAREAPEVDPASVEGADPDTAKPQPLTTSSIAVAGLKVICRLRFHGVRAGGISGSARIISTGRSTESSPRAWLTHDGVWSTDPEGAVSVAFSLNVERIESDLVGGNSSELTNVVVQFPGTMAGRVFVGAVSVYKTGGATISKAPENGIRAVMKEITSPRCGKCHDPIEFGRSPCHSPCGVVDYCSQTCQTAHQAHYERVRTHLARYGGPNAARCTATFGGVEFPVFWAAATGPVAGPHNLTVTAFNILVDSTNHLGIAYEMRVDVLIDARAGTSVAYINPDDKPLPADSDVICQNYNVLESVIYSAVQRGCGALAATCLNHLFRWCDYAEFVERLYLHYYDLCIGSGWEGQRVISTLGEYMLLVRPMYEGSTVLVEAALKSMTAADFWFRLENAKGILVTLYNLNGSVTFTPSAQPLRTTIVSEQQRQTLLLLARVFVIMATRTGREFAPKMLKRAEECYRDALDEDKCRNNFQRMGITSTQLAALYQLFPEKEDRIKTNNMREQGLQYLNQAVRSGQDTTMTAISQLVSMVHDDIARAYPSPPSAATTLPPAVAPEAVTA